MKNKIQIISIKSILISLFLIFLLACSSSNEIVAKQTDDVSNNLDSTNKDISDGSDKSNKDLDDLSCEKVICNNGFSCEHGECICEGKMCNNFCITSEDGCCSDSDCKDDERCNDNMCEKIVSCKFNEHLDLSLNECVCDEGFFFCEDQNKCIKKGDCCDQGDCDRYSYCSPTSESVEICLQYPNKKICRLLMADRPSDIFQTPLGDFLVEFMGVFSGDRTKVKIEDSIFELDLNERVSAARGTAWVEEIQTYGGFCKVDGD